MSWEIVYTKQAQKDAKKLAASGLKAKKQKLLEEIGKNFHKKPIGYQRLTGDLTGAYSRRINIQHRLVCQFYENERIVKVLRLWTP